MNTLLRVLTPATIFLTPCWVLSACGGSSDSSVGSGGASSNAGASAGSGPASSAGAAGAGDSSKPVGSFQVKVTPKSDLGDATTNIVGKVYDGSTPSATKP